MEPTNENNLPVSIGVQSLNQPNVNNVPIETHAKMWNPQPKVTYAFTITLAILSLITGAISMYYWGLKQQITTEEQTLSRSMVPVLPLSPKITSPTSKEIIYKNVPFKLSWTPVRLKEGEATQVWAGNTLGKMVELDLEGVAKPENGSQIFTLNDEFWRIVKPVAPCDNVFIRIDIGHNEKSGPGVLEFVTDSSMRTSALVLESTSTPSSVCYPVLNVTE